MTKHIDERQVFQDRDPDHETADSVEADRVTDDVDGQPGTGRLENSALPDTDADTDPDGKSRWSRRHFLGSLLAGAAGLVAACSRSKPSPTPTPTATHTPTAVAGSTPATAYTQYFPIVENSSPLATPTPTEVGPSILPTPPKVAAQPTSAPPPPTPTPIATPFPPGPPSKLGLFVARNDPQIFTLLETQGVAVVKTLELDANFAGQIKITSPRAKLIGRIDLPQVQLSALEPLGAARAFVDQLLPYADDPARRPYFDAWESYNEPVPGNADEMKRLADFEAERTRLLAERGIRSVIGNFGTGQPPLEMWEHFLPAVQAAQEHDGWLGLHEYSAPTIYYLSSRADQGRYPGVSPQDSGWLTLRYRHVYSQVLAPAGLVVPLVMTELGVDGLVQDRPGPSNARGWQHFQDYWAKNGYGLWGPGAYIEQLVWYDRAMQQNDYVIGGCIYALAASHGWQSYEIGGPAVGVLKQYLSVHAAA